MRFFTVDVLKNRMTADDELEMEERIHDASTGHEKRPYMTQLWTSGVTCEKIDKNNCISNFPRSKGLTKQNRVKIENM